MHFQYNFLLSSVYVHCEINNKNFKSLPSRWSAEYQKKTLVLEINQSIILFLRLAAKKIYIHSGWANKRKGGGGVKKGRRIFFFKWRRRTSMESGGKNPNEVTDTEFLFAIWFIKKIKFEIHLIEDDY